MERVNLGETGWAERVADRRLFLVAESVLGIHVLECKVGEKPTQVARWYEAEVLEMFTGRYDAENAAAQMRAGA